ncbi:MAG: SUMF1/EgtB/PvdO family nonheme iron enzyme [Verrucomicrobia bacterium]|nr:SUMF1/EgtB/PvdO family nonheme iron enzyme [Verrucomicrobiota bacterium]
MISALGLLVLFGFWTLSKLGPKNIDYANYETSQYEITDAMRALQAASFESELNFEEILSLRQPNAEDVATLKQSLDLQEQYIKAIPGYDVDGEIRLKSLRERYAEYASIPIIEKSRKLEQEADSLTLETDFVTAHESMKGAFELQKRINENYPESPYANYTRATLLQRKARYLIAEPIYQKSLELEEEADGYIKEKDWVGAEQSLKKAIDIQLDINRSYRGTKQGSTLRIELLKNKLLGIQSGQSNLEIIALGNKADALKAQGEMLDSAHCYQEAARLQTELNKAYPESPHASSDRVSYFLRKAQTAQSFELGRAIESNHARLQKILAERRTYDAVEIIAQLNKDIQYMQDAYPRSSLFDEQLQLKTSYLAIIQNDLGFIQDRVYAMLLPIPEVEEWQMAKTEVSQVLYQFIMGENPSRNIGERNPVDSISWMEAKDFCKRLGWIIGKSIRLPTEHEFRQALGPLRYVVLEKHVWSVSDAREIAKPIGQKEPFASGYYDLLGNVSEWLESVDHFDDEDARHIGGHAGDRIEVIFGVPVRNTSRAERNRMTGFRFVVSSN